MAKNTQQPEVSTSSEAPAETKVVKVTINGQVKDVTCKLVKSGLYSNNSYAYEGEDGNVLFEGYKVKHYCKDNQTFIQDGKGKNTYFDEQGKQIKKPKQTINNRFSLSLPHKHCTEIFPFLILSSI